MLPRRTSLSPVRGVALMGTLALVGAACARAPFVAPAPSPVASSRAAEPRPPAPEAAPAPLPGAQVAPPAPSSLGRFRPALRLASDESGCPALFTDLAVPAPGDAWFVGSCGARVHLASDRFVSMRPRAVRRTSAPGQTCPAYPYFLSVFARSTAEVYFTGTLGCGLDPSLVSHRALERWDGKAMRSLPSAYLHATPYDSAPGALAAGPTGPLHCIGKGDAESGPPKDGIYRYGKGGWGKPLRFGLPHDYPAGEPPADWDDATRMESYAALAVNEAGALWVVGKRKAPTADGAGSAVTGLALRLEAGTWTERTVDDTSLSDLSIAADGSTWAAGARLWRLAGDAFAPVALGLTGELEVRAVWARSATDVWLVLGETTKRGSVARVAHFDGARATLVPVDAAGDDEPARVRGSGDEVWLLGASTAWRLGADAGARRAPVVVEVKSAGE